MLKGGAQLAVLVGVASVVALLGAAPASADPSDTITLKLDSNSSEYGQGWNVEGDLASQAPCNSSSANCADYLIVTIDGKQHNLGQTHYDPSSSTIYFGDYDLMPGTILGVGTHTLSAKLVIGSTIEAQSAHPLTLTLSKTSVTTTTTIVPDPNNSANVIVTSRLDGNYIDQLPNCGCEDAGNYGLPAGTWNLAIKDASGKTVFSKQENSPANGDPVFVNYWQSVPSGVSLNAESSFTVSGSTASNFTMSSQKFPWTSTTTSGSTTTTPTAKPHHVAVKSASFEPPLFVFYAALLVAVVLVLIDVLLLVRRRRNTPPTEGAKS